MYIYKKIEFINIFEYPIYINILLNMIKRAIIDNKVINDTLKNNSHIREKILENYPNTNDIDIVKIIIVFNDTKTKYNLDIKNKTIFNKLLTESYKTFLQSREIEVDEDEIHNVKINKKECHSKCINTSKLHIHKFDDYDEIICEPIKLQFITPSLNIIIFYDKDNSFIVNLFIKLNCNKKYLEIKYDDNSKYFYEDGTRMCYNHVSSNFIHNSIVGIIINLCHDNTYYYSTLRLLEKPKICYMSFENASLIIDYALTSNDSNKRTIIDKYVLMTLFRNNITDIKKILYYFELNDLYYYELILLFLYYENDDIDAMYELYSFYSYMKNEKQIKNFGYLICMYEARDCEEVD